MFGSTSGNSCRWQTDPISEQLARSYVRQMGLRGCREGVDHRFGVNTTLSRPSGNTSTSSVRQFHGRGSGGIAPKRGDSTRTVKPGTGRVLLNVLSGAKKGWGHAPHLEPEEVQRSCQEDNVQDGDTQVNPLCNLQGPLVGFGGLEGCLPSCPNSARALEVLEVPLAGTTLSVPSLAIRTHDSTEGLHKGLATTAGVSQAAGHSPLCIPGRYSAGGFGSKLPGPGDTQHLPVSDRYGVYNKPQEVGSDPMPGPSIHWGQAADRLGHGISTTTQTDSIACLCEVVHGGGRVSSGHLISQTVGNDGSLHRGSPIRTSGNETGPMVSEEEVAGNYGLEPQGHGDKGSEVGPGLVEPSLQFGRRGRVTTPAIQPGGDHRRQWRRLGWLPAWHGADALADSGRVDSARKTASHKRARAASCPPSFPTLRGAVARKMGDVGMRQYCDSRICQPPGGCTVSEDVQGGLEVFSVPPAPQNTSEGCSSARSRQYSGGLSQSPQSRFEGMEAVSPNRGTDFPGVWNAHVRPVRDKVQSPASPVLLSDVGPASSGLRCSQSELEGRSAPLCFPSNSSSVESPQQDQVGRGVSSVGGTEVATQALVQSPATPVLRGSSSASSEAQPPLSDSGGEGDSVSLRFGNAPVGGLEAERERLRGEGLSEAAVVIATSAIRSSSRQVYDARWNAWSSWCGGRGVDPVNTTVSKVLDFLTSKVPRLSVSTLKGYLTAISKRHGLVEGFALSLHPTVCMWRKGLEKSQGLTRSIAPPWSLELVLASLKTSPYEPLRLADDKHLTWKVAFLVALTSARRASEIHALRADPPYISFSTTTVTLFTDVGFLPKVSSRFHATMPLELPALRDESDSSLRLLCVRRALNYYLERSKRYRQADVSQLFVCYGSKKRGSAVSKQRISRWLVECIGAAYQAIGQDPPEGVKGHQTRSQATSWAEMAGVNPQTICNAATWSSTCTFAQHYRLNVVSRQRSDFGRRVLALAGSTPASSSALTGYVIPRKRKK